MYATLILESYCFLKICKPLVIYPFYCTALFHCKMRRHVIKVKSAAQRMQLCAESAANYCLLKTSEVARDASE